MTDLLFKKNANLFLPVSDTVTHYAEASEEDRCAPRHRLAIPAKLRFSCSNSFAIVVTDMSLAGFACDALLEIGSGTRCWLTLPGLGALEAEVVRTGQYGLGCAFVNLLSLPVLDSFIAKYPAKELESLG